MREAAADLQGGGQDHRRGGMRLEQGETGEQERERGKMASSHTRAGRNEETTEDDR